MTGGFLEVENGRLYYEVEGEGPPLVLIHAGIADLRMWDDQVLAFAEHYRVVRSDIRTYGRSETSEARFSPRHDLRDLLRHLGIPSAHVLGLSFGGQIAVDFALESPAMVGALIPVAAGVSGFRPEPTEQEGPSSPRWRTPGISTTWSGPLIWK